MTMSLDIYSPYLRLHVLQKHSIGEEKILQIPVIAGEDESLSGINHVAARFSWSKRPRPRLIQDRVTRKLQAVGARYLGSVRC